jgi:hypothetical protein
MKMIKKKELKNKKSTQMIQQVMKDLTISEAKKGKLVALTDVTINSLSKKIRSFGYHLTLLCFYLFLLFYHLI